MDLAKDIQDIFLLRGVDHKGNEMNIDEIAQDLVCHNNEYKDANPDDLRKKISSCMARATTKVVKGKRVENKDSIFMRVKNGKGGYKKGVYALRKPKKPKAEKAPEPIIKPVEKVQTVHNLYLGSAGEMAVCSELLFREYNISRMAVDDGIDIVAIKSSKTYYIQVKTCTIQQESFTFQIGVKSFERYKSNDCYYIFVARASETKFIICTADDIRRFVMNGCNKGDRNISIRFVQNGGHLLVGEENVEYMINSFERIL